MDTRNLAGIALTVVGAVSLVFGLAAVGQPHGGHDGRAVVALATCSGSLFGAFRCLRDPSESPPPQEE